MLNEYCIVERVATGGFGVIFKVRRELDNEIFAMKRIALSDLNAQQRKDAAQEIHVMRRLQHPFIVSLRDAFRFNYDSLCIVMDYYDGGDLDTLLARQKERDEYFPLERVMAWFTSMCLAVQYMHAQGIIHRDLKTHNAFLHLRSDEVAIGDFGVAELMQTNSNNSDNNNNDNDNTTMSTSSISTMQQRHSGALGCAVRGTPLYMAPEALETGTCSPSSDVWSLGCILYELLSLCHPFESRDVATLMMRVAAGVRRPLPSHYPVEITELINLMLTHDAAQRPSCEEILRSPVLQSYLQRLAIRRVPRDTPDSSVERSWMMQLQALNISTNLSLSDVSPPREMRPTLLPSQERFFSTDHRLTSPGFALPFLHKNSTSWGSTERSPKMPLLHQQESTSSSSLVTSRKATMEVLLGESIRHLYLSGDSNVEDMRHKPLKYIEEEVVRYRQLVQSEIRMQKQQRDASLLRNQSEKSMADKVYYRNSLPNAKVLRGVNGKTPNSSPIRLMQNGQLVFEGGGGGEEDAKLPLGSLEAALEARRQQRIEMAVHVLGEAVFFSVYNYYKAVDVVERDIARVINMVPDRSQWHVLPIVEEVVVIDRLLMRAAASGT